MTTEKPKQTVHKVINKSLIAWGITPKQDLRVYYQWSLPKRFDNMPFIIVDYNPNKREWYTNYIDKNTYTYTSLQSCTIDDITGSSSIASFDNVH